MKGTIEIISLTLPPDEVRFVKDPENLKQNLPHLVSRVTVSNVVLKRTGEAANNPVTSSYLNISNRTLIFLIFL